MGRPKDYDFSKLVVEKGAAMKFIELESERLIYRKFNENDFPTVFDWVSNAENMKYREGPHNESQACGYLNFLISCTNAEDISHCE